MLRNNYDLNNSHVLPALLRKFHEAKVEGAPFVEVWGTGSRAKMETSNSIKAGD
jgi:hypothetical protein